MNTAGDIELELVRRQNLQVKGFFAPVTLFFIVGWMLIMAASPDWLHIIDKKAKFVLALQSINKSEVFSILLIFFVFFFHIHSHLF